MNARPAHPHGTTARYNGNRSTPACRCPLCRRAAVRADAVREIERLAGNPRRVPTAPVREHVEQLRAQGLLDSDILRAAGITSQSIMRGGDKQPTMSRARAQAILAIPLDHQPDSGYVAAAGAIRRVQALCSIGHSAASIAQHLGVTRQWITRLAQGRQNKVSFALSRSIKDLYAQLVLERGTCARAIQAAQRNGWHGPDAWDDDIDDPKAVPNAELHLTERQQADERLDDIVRLASAGSTPDQIAQRTGLTRGYVRTRLKAERPVTLLELTA